MVDGQGSGNQRLRTNCRLSETRNLRPGTRNPKPETRYPKPETRYPKPGTRYLVNLKRKHLGFFNEAREMISGSDGANARRRASENVVADF